MIKIYIRLGIFVILLALLSGSVYASEQRASTSITVCGNGIKEAGEVCDGSDLGGQTCVGLGYAGGTLACKADCTFNTSGCYYPAAPGAPAPPPVTKVVLQGKAYPLSPVTVLQDGKIVTTTIADSLANFKVEITNITAGTYNFGLWAEDKQGRKSITFSFSATVISGITTTIFDIFIPPTIELEKVNILKGETLKILGQTAPESELSIHVESPQEIVKKIIADEKGDWKYLFDTSPLEEGMHITRAKAESSEGLLSSFSRVLSFYVGKYGVGEISPRADFNRDGRTNLIDFSIMLYWWGKYNPAVDMNQDGIVNLPDFSILMYYWSG